MDHNPNLKISLVIPVYHEADAVKNTATKLSKLLARMRNQHPVEVVFVDDGSPDNTRALLDSAFADDAQVRVIAHEAPRGLGQALRTGFSLVTGDIVITTDFDHAYNLNTIPQILAHLLVYDADLVTASPYHPKGGIEGLRDYRRLLRPGINYIYRLLVKRDIYTWTSLFRAYRREALDGLTFESHGALANTELLVNAIRSGYKVSEYPINASATNTGRSDKHRLSSVKDHLRYQLKLLFLSRKDPQPPASLTHRPT